MKLDTDKVRWHRDRLGWTLETLAERAEVAEGTALRAEHGEDIRPSSGRRIARALGVDVSELVPEPPGVVLPKGEAPSTPGQPETREDRGFSTRKTREFLLPKEGPALPIADQVAEGVQAAVSQVSERMGGRPPETPEATEEDVEAAIRTTLDQLIRELNDTILVVSNPDERDEVASRVGKAYTNLLDGLERSLKPIAEAAERSKAEERRSRSESSQSRR